MSGAIYIKRSGAMAFLYFEMNRERYKVTRGISGTMSVHVLRRDRVKRRWHRLWRVNSKLSPGQEAQSAIDLAARGNGP